MDELNSPGPQSALAEHDGDNGEEHTESDALFPARLIQAYRRRLRIDEHTALEPTKETLSLLVERHLEYIPFTNLDLHVTTIPEASSSSVEHENEAHGKTKNSPILLEPIEALMEKVLLHGRGGCCLELNGLFAVFLEALGFRVWKVPCFVYAGSERGHVSSKSKFRTTASHFLLLVQEVAPVRTNRSSSPPVPLFVVDVGLGEPPMGPLEYVLDRVQQTAEGMQSRIILDPQGSFTDRHGRNRTCVILQWKVSRTGGFQCKDDEDTTKNDFVWEHRLQWDLTDAPLWDLTIENIQHQTTTHRRSLQSFDYVIPILMHKKSTFARKLIVCKLTRSLKLSLSGHTIKRTNRQTGEIEIQQVEKDSVSLFLEDEFSIQMSPSETIVPAALDQDANAKLWGHL